MKKHESCNESREVLSSTSLVDENKVDTAGKTSLKEIEIESGKRELIL